MRKDNFVNEFVSKGRRRTGMTDKGQRSYIAIDLKSFYASVECKERELDPMTTNLVVADKSRTEKTGSVSFLEILWDTGPCQTLRGRAEGKRSE